MERVKFQPDVHLRPLTPHPRPLTSSSVNGDPHRIRFYALTRVLGISANTIYLWRRGGLPDTPALQVEVERVKNKNKVWVRVDRLDLWLKENRPKLLKNLHQYLASLGISHP
jgi:hypothetical protein